MAETLVKACVCTSKYQDERYGKGNRLHNLSKDGASRCTQCGRGKKAK